MNLAIAKENYYNIYEKLEHKFLYNNDLNSIHILLNLYDLDKNIKNIHPKYISSDRVRKSISNILEFNENGEEIASIISRVLHEDISRLELYICIEGYKNGYFNKRLANKLENITIENISCDRLYNKEYLHHFDTSSNEIVRAKYKLYRELDENLESKEIYSLISDYNRLVIETKLLNINSDLEKEMEIEPLAPKEIEDVIENVFKIILDSTSSIYKESYWYGLNDRVLKRYR